MEGIDDKNIYLLKDNGEINKVIDAKTVDNKEILDLLDNWALVTDRESEKLYKINLKTKENIGLIGLTDTIDIHEIFFYNSNEVLIGETVENNNYEVFLFKDGNKKIMQKGRLLGPVKNGFVYKKYTHGNDNGKGDIYAKILKE